MGESVCGVSVWCVYGMCAYLYLFMWEVVWVPMCPGPLVGSEDSVGGVLTFPS